MRPLGSLKKLRKLNMSNRVVISERCELYGDLVQGSFLLELPELECLTLDCCKLSGIVSQIITLK